MSTIKAVKEWSLKAGLLVNEKFTLDVNQVDKNLAVDLIKEELDELVEAIGNNDKEEVIDALNDLQWVLDRAKLTFGLDNSSFEELVKSNNTKLCNSIYEAEISQELYANGLHPNKIGKHIDTIIEKNNGFYILKNKNGKMLKSKNFIDCSYERYIEWQHQVKEKSLRRSLKTQKQEETEQ